jgi:hypothetical protein
MGDAIHLSDQEINESLDIARQLIGAGIPVFAAAPCPDNCPTPGHRGTEFHLPTKWQLTVPSAVWLDRWRPGWGLAAVGGHMADVLDQDDRHGGNESAREMRGAGLWPRTFGQQETPSGGRHFLISATGEARAAGLLPGIDLQGGKPDGTGRGFAWIAPTVKRSKGADAGQLRPYRWIEVPDLALLADFAGSDDSVEGVRTLVARARVSTVTSNPSGPSPGPSLGDGPFVTASQATSQLFAGAGPDVRAFTEDEARAYVAPVLERLRSARVGEIEERCNAAAAVLSHFVPALLTPDAGMEILREALAATAYDEAHPASAWTVEKFRPVLDGRRPVADPWKAERRELLTAQQNLEVSAPADAVEAMLAEMLTLGQLKDRPPPRPLIKGLLNLDSEAWLIGAPGCRKSFVALDMACHVAAGWPWQGLKVERGTVVLIAAEGAGGLGKRVRAWEATHGPLPDGVHVLPRPVQAGDRAAWAVLVEAAGRLLNDGPGLVVLDTQARVTVGLDENDATDMGHYVLAVNAIKRRTGACVLTVHHTGRKGGDARGSSAIDGAQDTELKVEKVDGEGLRGRLLVEKQKDLDERAPMDLVFTSVVVGVDEDGEPVTSLALVSDPFLVASGAGPGSLEDERAASAREADLQLSVLLQQREPWETGYSGHQIRIIKILLHVGGSVGLTEDKVKSNLVEYFGPIARTSWSTAWRAVRELQSARGELLVVNVGGARYAVDPDAVVDLPPGKSTR